MKDIDYYLFGSYVEYTLKVQMIYIHFPGNNCMIMFNLIVIYVICTLRYFPRSTLFHSLCHSELNLLKLK
jgi:hypothetical protein